MSRTRYKSIINKLKDNNLVSDDLLVLVNNLSLEDIIALKFELSSRMLKKRMYGFDIWRNSKYIVQEAMLKFAISATKSKKDAARFLGLDYKNFSKLVKKFGVQDYFDQDSF
jgi:hypothetical protein|tara:strand:- start:447 stop:782 length:336 start_codon:yes stop_codon:yes gene_type:complete